MKRREFAVRLSFNPHDVWIGAYWKRRRSRDHWNGDRWDALAVHTQVWVCIVPMFPIHFAFFHVLDEGKRSYD